MSSDRQNSQGSGPPANHNNNTTTTANNNNNNANNNNNLNPGMPVGMHGMQPGIPAGMQAGIQAGMASAMQAGMPAGLQANMSSGIRSPVPQVQLIHSPLPGPPYLSQFPYNQQLMLQNAAVQAAMQAQMNQQLNLAMQGRPPSVSPKSPGLPVLSPSPSSTQASMSMPGTSTSSPSTTTSTSGGSNGSKSHPSKSGSNGNQQQVAAAMMGGKATMIPRTAQAPQPIVIGQIGVVPGQPVSSGGFLPQGCDPSQIINSQAQLRLTSQQQLVTSTGQIITSQPMLTNQAVLQAMASLQQQGIPIAHQPLLGTQTPSLIPGQPLFIRPAGPMQPQQNMMAAAAANVQTMNTMKNQKAVDMPTNLQTKPSNSSSGKSQGSAQGRNLTILPSTSRPGLSTARVYPTSLPPQSQSAKLNIPQVTPKLSKPKSRSHSSKNPSSSSATSQSKPSTVATPVKPTFTAVASSANGTPSTPSKSQSGSESDASKKASPSTPPATTVPLPAELPKAKSPVSMEADKSATEKPVEETAPVQVSTPAASERTEEEMEVDKSQEPKKDVVEKQRAIVKPHILTHVIEGFIIQEGPEPFPVQRSSLLTDVIPPKHNSEAKDSEEDHSPYAFRDPTPDDLERPSAVEEAEPQPVPAPLPTLKCEFCGKVAKAEKFRCSKRFCSTTCAKRYNVGCSRRLSLFKSSSSKDSSEQAKHLVRSVSVPAGRCMRKRKGLRLRKSWRTGRGGRMSVNSLSSPPPLEDNSSSRSEHESSSSVGSPSPPQEFEMETDDPNPQSNPSKWTVQDVYDFIKSITGCATYAEEFKAQEIDGQALLLLKEDHLMTTMNMKLGPALKICARINSLKDDYV